MLSGEIRQARVSCRHGVLIGLSALALVSCASTRAVSNAPLAQEGTDVAVRIRSSAPLQPATAYADGAKVRVLLAGAEYGVAAGQACVFYADAGQRARVLGGGWIERDKLSEAPPRKGGRSVGFAGASAPTAG